MMGKKPDVRILEIVAKLAQNDVKRDVLETEIITATGISEVEVTNSLNELEWLHLVKEALPRATRGKFRLWNITEMGLHELSHHEHE